MVPDAATLPLVAVAGPTGSGKSSLALAIAHRFDGEIVNCDSLQVYRRFDIGTAKLPPSEWCGVPHHLIDILNPPANTPAWLARRFKPSRNAGGCPFWPAAPAFTFVLY